MPSETGFEDIAILSLMMTATLARRLGELGQLDDLTTKRLRHLVKAAKAHAHFRSGEGFDDLFRQIDKKLDLVA